MSIDLTRKYRKIGPNATWIEPIAGFERCDFCGGLSPVWHIDCRDFAMLIGGVTFVSIDGWDACDYCGQLLLAGNRTAVTERAIRAYMTRHPDVPEAVVRPHVETLHKAVWAGYRSLTQATATTAKAAQCLAH